MANSETIKTTIDVNINTNGNQAITGAVMNSVLKQMVDSADAELAKLSARKCEFKILSNNILDKKSPFRENGVISYSVIGAEIAISDNANLSVYCIKVEPSKTYTFTNVRTYAISDTNNIVIKANTTINQDEVLTITIPTDASKLWLSVYNNRLDVVQVNKASSLLEYDDFLASPSVGNYDMNATFREYIRDNQFYKQDTYHFELGTISNGSLVDNIARIRCRIPLIANEKNHISIQAPQNIIIKAVATESNNGTITTVPVSTNEFVGTDEIKYAWIVLAIEGYVPESLLNECVAINRYLATIPQTNDNIDDNLSILSEETSNSNNEIELNKSISDREQEKLRKTISELENTISPLYLLGNPQDSQTIKLPHSDGGKFLLNIHKREKGGFAEQNNAYLPNARQDFSDVCVLANGQPLGIKKIYSGNIDILPDARLKPVSKGLIFTDSKGNLYGTNNDMGAPRMSSDGVTWEKIPAFIPMGGGVVCYVDSKDNIFVSDSGKLYKSMPPYTSMYEVLDTRQFHADSIIFSHGMIENPETGRLFVSTYQVNNDIHILSSDDNGENWVTSYRSDKYQHVHRLSVDRYSTPIAIYAGCDGGGGILKSTDNGNSWIDLREQNPNIPQATDFGIIYSDESGYRLSGGETSIVGGVSILKTNDDITFTPKLAIAKSVYFVEKLGNVLFASFIASKQFQTTGILISYDNGETWQTAMTTAPLFENGASDGYRYMSKIKGDEEYLICGIQTTGELQAIRIYEGGDNYYAQFLVEVPKGISEIVVESGHLISKTKEITNTFGYNEVHEFGTPLNLENIVMGVSRENASIIKGGRKLSEIYPPIQSVDDRQSLSLQPGFICQPEELDLSNKDFHIGFWLKSNSARQSSESNHDRTWAILGAKYIPGRSFLDSCIRIEEEFVVYVGNQSWNSKLYPGRFYGEWWRVDINITQDGKFEMFVNGISEGIRNSSDNICKYFTKGNVVCLYVPTRINTILHNTALQGIQYFEITEGNITQEEARLNYYGGVYDVY